MNYSAYPEYKDSGIEWLGEIPEHWVIKKGKYIFTNRKEVNKSLQCMERLALTMNGVIERSISSAEGLQPSDFASYQIFEKDDLVFKLIDLENFKTSRVGIVPKKGIMSSAYIRLIPSSSIYPKYYFYFYYDLYLRGIYNDIGGQGVRSALNAPDLLDLFVCVPDYADQEIIVNFIDYEITKIDDLINKNVRLISLLQEKRQAIISHAVIKGLDHNVPMKDSGIEWLGEIPEHWELTIIKRFSTLHRGHDLTDAERTGGNYPVVTSGGISGTHGSFMVLGPGVVTGRYGSTGRLFFIEEDFWPHNTSLYVSDFHGNLPRFVWYSLQTVDFAAHSAKAAVPGIDRNDIHVLPAVVPPLNEQAEIAAFLDTALAKIDDLIDKAQQQIEKLKEHRSALISAAVTGKIDVREWNKKEKAA